MHRLLVVLSSIALGLLGCAEPPPPNAAYACWGTLCPASYECRKGYCFPVGDDGGPPSDDGGQPGGDGGCLRETCRGDRDCGDIPDNCGGTLACGDCTQPETCGGSGRANICGCTPQTDQELCTGFACGAIEKLDRCGTERSLDCGGCAAGTACAGDAGQSSCVACSPESDPDFCFRHQATCGQLSALDNCSAKRVVSCGLCSSSPDAGGACLNRGQPCTYDWECCDGRSCFNGRCQRFDGGL